MGKLDGKVAIVTGASRGIGKAIAGLFAQEGAKVACTARTLEEGEHKLEGSLRTTVEAIRAAGGTATAFPCDVSDFEACERLIGSVHDAFGPVDVLVNNAALTYFMPVAEFPLKKWLKSFAVTYSQEILKEFGLIAEARGVGVERKGSGFSQL